MKQNYLRHQPNLISLGGPAGKSQKTCPPSNSLLLRVRWRAFLSEDGVVSRILLELKHNCAIIVQLMRGAVLAVGPFDTDAARQQMDNCEVDHVL